MNLDEKIKINTKMSTGDNTKLKYCSNCRSHINNLYHSTTDCLWKKQRRLKRKNIIHPINPFPETQPIQLPNPTSSKILPEKNVFIKKLFGYEHHLVISFEGNIGYGKATTLEYMNNLLENNQINVLTLREPLDLWTNLNGENLLEKM